MRDNPGSELGRVQQVWRRLRGGTYIPVAKIDSALFLLRGPRGCLMTMNVADRLYGVALHGGQKRYDWVCTKTRHDGKEHRKDGSFYGYFFFI